MYTVLLSGGSGKRLWPLSNDYRSKQYIKLFEPDGAEDKTKKISMIQRVMGQLEKADLVQKSMICASNAQVEIIKSQLGEVCIAVEPERRNTFAAVAISCAYAVSEMGAEDSDIITILPVDPYTEQSYFTTLSKLGEYLEKSGADIALMGAVPKEPSSKYGYIVPKDNRDGYFTVKSFREKPDLETAKDLIKQGAVFNCGVFCFRIGFMQKILEELNLTLNYKFLYDNYAKIPKISFDYQVLEKAQNMIFVPFNGYWTDIGTWNALSDELRNEVLGNVVCESCDNTCVVNMLDIPVVTYGVSNSVVVASSDGILVAEKEHTENLRDLVNKIENEPRYNEYSWGQEETVKSATEYNIKYISVNKDSVFNINNNGNSKLVYTVLSGQGKCIVSQEQKVITKGDIIVLNIGDVVSFSADVPMKLLQIQFEI